MSGSSGSKVTGRKTFDLRLTKSELTHLRDLLGIVLPQDLKLTISQSLARCAGRSMIETRLWDKLATLCKLADVPLDEEAPDFTVSSVTNPTLEVCQIEREDDVLSHGDDDDS